MCGQWMDEWMDGYLIDYKSTAFFSHGNISILIITVVPPNTTEDVGGNLLTSNCIFNTGEEYLMCITMHLPLRRWE